MSCQERIIIDPEILVGKPVVKGTRLAVEFIIDRLASAWTEDEILRNYPGLTREDVLACLRYASSGLQAEKVYLLAACVMRILADENCPSDLVDALQNQGNISASGQPVCVALVASDRVDEITLDQCDAHSWQSSPWLASRQTGWHRDQGP